MIKKGSKGNRVKEWQKFLKGNISPNLVIDGYFGSETDEATRNFQKKTGLIVDGIVGHVTLARADIYGNDNLIKKNKQIRTEKQLLQWIYNNLGDTINEAIRGTSYSVEWLCAIVAREVGFLIMRYWNQGDTYEEITLKMLGDYKNNYPRGYSYFQLDIRSYPEFIDKGLWMYPKLSALQAVLCLEGKRNALDFLKYELTKDNFERAITAAYNCGASRVIKAIRNNYDIDHYTFNKDYSREVFRMKEICKNEIINN